MAKNNSGKVHSKANLLQEAVNLICSLGDESIQSELPEGYRPFGRIDNQMVSYFFDEEQQASIVIILKDVNLEQYLSLIRQTLTALRDKKGERIKIDSVQDVFDKALREHARLFKQGRPSESAVREIFDAALNKTWPHYEVLVPIQQLHIGQNKIFKFQNIHFSTFNRSSLGSDLRKVYRDDPRYTMNLYNKEFKEEKNEIFGCITLQSFDEKTAKTHATELVGHAIQSINFIAGLYHDLVDLSTSPCRLHLGQQLESKSSNTHLRETGDMDRRRLYGNIKHEYGVHIDRLKKKDMIRKVLEVMTVKHSQDNKSVRYRVDIATYWCGMAMWEPDNGLSLLYYMMALESIFNNKSTEIAESLASRTARFWNGSLENRVRVYSKVKELYNNRSTLTHGNRMFTNDGAMRQMKVIVVETLLKVILHKGKRPYIDMLHDDFIKYLQQLQLK